MWKDTVLACIKVNIPTNVEGLRKETGADLNPRPPEYETV
jgi:hypothetical protein